MRSHGWGKQRREGDFKQALGYKDPKEVFVGKRVGRKRIVDRIRQGDEWLIGGEEDVVDGIIIGTGGAHDEGGKGG